MSSTTESLALLQKIITELRAMLGDDVIPCSASERVALSTIRNIQEQRRSLHQSGVKMGLAVLAKAVCEAQIFSEDKEENWVLQYAYQKIGMKHLGEMRRQQARRDADYKQYLLAQEAEYGGRG